MLHHLSGLCRGKGSFSAFIPVPVNVPRNPAFSFPGRRGCRSCNLAGETLGVLFLAQRRRIQEPARELLVPARDQGRAFDDAASRCIGFFLDGVLGDDPVHESFLEGLLGAEDPALEQDFQSRRTIR